MRNAPKTTVLLRATVVASILESYPGGVHLVELMARLEGELPATWPLVGTVGGRTVRPLCSLQVGGRTVQPPALDVESLLCWLLLSPIDTSLTSSGCFHDTTVLSTSTFPMLQS